MAKLDDGPGSHTAVLKQLAQRYAAVTELGQIVTDMTETLSAVRIIMKYMEFDLEATRRERDQLRTMLEDQN